MKKRVMIGIVIAIVLILAILVGIKVRHYVIVGKVINAVEEYNQSNNHYYKIETEGFNTSNSREVYYKDQIVLQRATGDYFVWQNLNTNERFSVDVANKQYHKFDDGIIFDFKLQDIAIRSAGISKFWMNQLKILSVTSVKSKNWEGTECYRVETKDGTTYIDKKTLLPIKYFDKYTKEELTFITKTGTVTDSDVNLNIEGYTLQ